MDQIDLRQDLIEACKRQDRWAQKQLYSFYADAMYNVACRIVKNEEDAQDVLQNAFLDVFRGLKSYKYQSTPGAWIKRIVVNRALSYLKKKKRLQFAELNDEIVSDIPEESFKAIDSININLVKSKIEQLSDGYRTVLNLYLVEGYDHKEIAQILEISEATSKSQYSRAKKRLRKLIKTIDEI